MGFRGDDFVLLDAECLGDGQDDTQPMDTWLANRLWGNTMYLAGEPRCVCWSPAISFADIDSAVSTKPYAIIDRWATVWAGLMYIHPGQRGLNIYPTGIIASSGSGTIEIKIKVRVQGLGEVEDTYARTETLGSALVRGRERISCTFDETFISDAPELRWVEISMRSDAIVSRYSAVTGTGKFSGYFVQDTDASPVFANSTVGNPDTDSLEQMAIEPANSGQSANTYNILGVTELSSSKDSEVSRAYLVEAGPVTQGYAWDYDLEYIAYWSPRSIVFEPYMDRESAGRLNRATLEPNKPVDYGPAVQQVSAISQLHLRPRTIGLGPRGVMDTGESFYGGLGYRFCWPFVMGDDAAATIIDDSIMLTTENPIIEVKGWCIVVQHDSSVNWGDVPPGGWGKSGSGLRNSNKKSSDYSDAPGRVQWDFEGSVTQLADKSGGGATWAADATGFGTSSDEMWFGLHPTNYSPDITPAPIARGLEHMYQGTKVSPFDQWGWFKEGSLVDPLDSGYLQPFSLRIDTSGMTSTETGLPFRLKVTAEHNTAADNDYLRTVPGGSDATVRFVLGHYTIVELPTNG